MAVLIASFIFLLCVVHGSFGHNEDIAKFMKVEKTFIRDLEDYIESQESVLQLLRKKLLNFKVEHAEASVNPETYYANEVNKFLLVKRLASDIELLSDKTHEVASKFKSKARSYERNDFLPSKDNLKTSALSIAGLQKDQNLRADKLAKGIFGDVKRRNGLSTEDCYQLGKQLNSARVHSFAIEWLTEAMKRYDEYYDQHQVKAVDILEELALSFLGNNQIQEAEKIVEKVSRMNATSNIVKLFKLNERPESIKRKRATTRTEARQELCHSKVHFLKSSVITCPI